MPHVIEAETAHHEMTMAGGTNTVQYVLLALRYLSALAGILQGIAAGNLDQHVNGVRVNGKTYDAEIIWKERVALPSPPA